MITFIYSNQEKEWDEILDRFPNASIYYTRHYCKAFQIHGDGIPTLLYYENESNLKGICVIMKRDVASSSHFSSNFKEGEIYDAVTPYGYGGFIFNREPSQEEQEEISKELKLALQKENIISLFIRFSPVLKNADSSRHILEVIDLGKTVSMDLNSEEELLMNMKRENRNRIRKAHKNGITVNHATGEEITAKFIPVYEETMKADNAQDYYYFKPEFYESIIFDLKGNHQIFYAEYEGEIISVAIIIYKNGYMDYHLSGTKREFRNLAAHNLLIYEAALWGIEQGFKNLHLGGGVGSGDDNLYRFKSTFNRNCDNRFSIGKLVVDSDKYKQLVNLRAESDSTFDRDSSFFPLYRS